MANADWARPSSLFRNLRQSAGENRAWLVIPATVAVVARLGYVLLVKKDTIAWGDEIAYTQLAQNILDYGCFCFIPEQPSVFRAPLYPAILALVFAIFGSNHMAVLVLQGLAGGIGALFVGVIGRQVSGSVLVAALAGWLFALNPLLIFATGVLYTESFYFLFVLATTIGLHRLASQPDRQVITALAIGGVIGLSLLMKPNLALFIALLPLWGWIAMRSLRRAVLVAGCIGIAMLLMVLPWTLRNYAATGQAVLVSANSGLVMWQGNNPQANGIGLDWASLEPLPGLSEVEQDRVYMRWALDWIHANPTEFLKLVPLKVYKLLSPLETTTRGSLTVPGAELILTGFGVYYGLAIWGLIATRRQWRDWSLIHLFIGYPIVVAAITHGGTRYGMVAQPFISLLAAVSIFSLSSALTGSLRSAQSKVAVMTPAKTREST